MFITHFLQLNLQLHNFDLFKTCRRPTSSFCTVVWQLASFQLTRRIARKAALTGKHDTLVRRAPGWQGAPDGQQAKN